eukprot:20039-Rhodomonas_salina.1
MLLELTSSRASTVSKALKSKDGCARPDSPVLHRPRFLCSADSPVPHPVRFGRPDSPVLHPERFLCTARRILCTRIRACTVGYGVLGFWVCACPGTEGEMCAGMQGRERKEARDYHC